MSKTYCAKKLLTKVELGPGCKSLQMWIHFADVSWSPCPLRFWSSFFVFSSTCSISPFSIVHMWMWVLTLLTPPRRRHVYPSFHQPTQMSSTIYIYLNHFYDCYSGSRVIWASLLAAFVYTDPPLLQILSWCVWLTHSHSQRNIPLWIWRDLTCTGACGRESFPPNTAALTEIHLKKYPQPTWEKGEHLLPSAWRC